MKDCGARILTNTRPVDLMRYSNRSTTNVALHLCKLVP